MKKTLLLYVGLLLLFAAQVARAAPANATFIAERGVVFQLIFDGRALTQAGTQQVRLDRIAPGYHQAEFFIPTRYGRSINYRTRVFLDEGLESTFVLVTRSGYPPVLRKVSALPIPRRGAGNGPHPSYPPTLPPAPDYGNEPAYPESYPGRAYVMAPQEVAALFDAVQRQPFDDNKLPIIRTALQDVTIPADDARRFVATLAFDRNRIELAKYMYSRVADPQNFYQVYDALQYPSSIREVQQYVESFRR